MGIFQARIDPPAAGTSFAGKTIIITGASDGLGLEATRQFAQLGAQRIILPCRSVSKGEAQIASLRADPQITTQLDVIECDLQDYASVLAFATRVRADTTQIDILLCNAGMNVVGYQTSPSGHELMMQVNAYSQFLLALELLPLLRSAAAGRGAPSHLTFTSSMQHDRHSLDKSPLQSGEAIFARFDDRAKYSVLSRYPDTKMVDTAFARELAARVSSEQVIVNDLCPGFVRTNLDHALPPWLKYPGLAARWAVARSVEEGARTLVYAAGIVGNEAHGMHVRHNRPKEPIPFFSGEKGKEFQKKLWDECVAEFKTLDPSLETDF